MARNDMAAGAQPDGYLGLQKCQYNPANDVLKIWVYRTRKLILKTEFVNTICLYQGLITRMYSQARGGAVG